jgi:hypothetical protein
MKRYTKVDVGEQLLEDLIRQNAEMIEGGLAYLDHQKQTIRGRLDMLLADSANALVIAELKVTQDDGMLMQGVDYYDDVTRNIETYARLFSKRKIDLEKAVRLLLVAPSFSQTLVSRVKWLNLPISLFTYTCIQIEGENDPVVVFSERETPQQRGADAGVYTLERHLDYATDPIVRNRIIKLIEAAKQWTFGHVTVDPIKYSLSFKVNGTLFAYLDVKRKHFVVDTEDDDGIDKNFPVRTEEDYESVLNKMSAAAQRITGHGLK